MNFCKFCGSEVDEVTGRCLSCGRENAVKRSGRPSQEQDREITIAADSTRTTPRRQIRTEPRDPAWSTARETTRTTPRRPVRTDAQEPVQGAEQEPVRSAQRRQPGTSGQEPTRTVPRQTTRPAPQEQPGARAAQRSPQAVRVPDDRARPAGRASGRFSFDYDEEPQYDPAYDDGYAPRYREDYRDAYEEEYRDDYDPEYGDGYDDDYDEDDAFDSGEPRNKMKAVILTLVAVVVVLIGTVTIFVMKNLGVITIGKSKSDNEVTTIARRRAGSDGAEDGVDLTIEGMLQYVPGTKSADGPGDYYSIKLDGSMEFKPYAPYDETLGASIKRDEVQVIGEGLNRYVNHRVKVAGVQRYRSEASHKLDVILEMDTIEDLGESATTAKEATTEQGTTQAPPANGTSMQMQNAMFFREGPSTSEKKLGTVQKNAWVTVVTTENNWAYIYYEGLYGWVYAPDAFGTTTTNATTAATTTAPTEVTTQAVTQAPSAESGSTKVLRNDMRLRSGPGTEYSFDTVLPSGTTVTVLESSNGWSHVTCSAGTGWVYDVYAF